MTGLRLDKWLWFARFARTRSLAAKLCTSGAVAIADNVVRKPGQLVRVGDSLSVRQGRLLRRITVVALAERRGSPADARLLYAEPLPPVAVHAAEQAVWQPLIDGE